MPRPRTIKTHLHPHFFGDQIGQGQMKVIVVMRNPKDALVSYYHFMRMNKGLGQYKGTWDDFFEIVKANQLVYGSWFEHVAKWWKLQNNPNILFLKFEDMKKDPLKEVTKMAQFLGKHLEEEVLRNIVDHSCFDAMKANPSTNGVNNPFNDNNICQFMRKGEVGDWKNYFTEEQSQYVNSKMKETLPETGLSFDFNNDAE